jgi:hypothetical protein
MLICFAVSQTFTVAAVFGLGASYAPLALVRHRARQRLQELRELWPDAVDNLASAVRAGLSLPEALTQLGQRCLNSFDTPKLVCRLVAQPARHSRSEQTSPGPSRRRLHLGRLPDGMRQRAEPQQIPSVIAAGGQAGPGRSDGSSSEPGACA